MVYLHILFGPGLEYTTQVSVLNVRNTYARICEAVVIHRWQTFVSFDAVIKQSSVLSAWRLYGFGPTGGSNGTTMTYQMFVI